MSVEKVANPKSFIDSLGLHDVWIYRIEFDSEARVLAFSVPDLNANWTGLPEDPGRRPCTLIFHGVTTFACDVETSEGIWITDVEVLERDTKLWMEMDLQSGGGEATRGRRSIVFSFETLQIRDP